MSKNGKSALEGFEVVILLWGKRPSEGFKMASRAYFYGGHNIGELSLIDG